MFSFLFLYCRDYNDEQMPDYVCFDSLQLRIRRSRLLHRQSDSCDLLTQAKESIDGSPVESTWSLEQSTRREYQE